MRKTIPTLAVVAILTLQFALPALGHNQENGSVSCYPPRTVYTQIDAYDDHLHVIGTTYKHVAHSHLQRASTQHSLSYISAAYSLASDGTMYHGTTFGSCQW